jgi:hypothetical protein
MKYLIAFLIFITSSATAQKETHLLGNCTAKSLESEPYAEWYKPGYEHYQPNAGVVQELKN